MSMALKSIKCRCCLKLIDEVSVSETNLPAHVRSCLNEFLMVAKESLGDDLVSVVLFGTAAEGRMRSTSDVNLMLVLRAFDLEKVDPVRETYQLALAAVQLHVMFILESELPLACQTFPGKFRDIFHRHEILHGKNVVAGLVFARPAIIVQLKESLLNITLRLRERYAAVSLTPDRLLQTLAEISGPLRTTATNFMYLEQTEYVHPKEALSLVANKLLTGDKMGFLSTISQAREGAAVDSPDCITALKDIITLADKMLAHINTVQG